MASSRASQNGPDWLDVMSAVSAVEGFHKVSIEVIVMLPRPGRKGIMEVKAQATKMFSGSGVVWPSVSRSVLISSGDPVTVPATIFRLVYDLDRDCGAMWAQAELFESV